VGLFSWILFGLISGAIAKYIMPGKDPGGCIGTIIIGILGAVIGGFIATELLHVGSIDGFNFRSLAIAIAGSLILLILYRLLVARRPPP
jgi:uncharacterized membrane protein YeaQ/YmgE (transglycosylase-associated protein family)